MEILVHGSAGPHGWPQSGCRCASCSRLREGGEAFTPTRVSLDGVPIEECPRRAVHDGDDITAPGGGRVLYAPAPGARPLPDGDTVYDAALLDLLGAPEHLGLLRRMGSVGAATEIHAVHVDHRVTGPAELRRRLGFWTRAPGAGPHRTLLLGGVRSGKSAEAELRLAAEPEVCYVATGPIPETSRANETQEASEAGEGRQAGGAHEAEPDAAWAARVRAHRERRPSWWSTRETHDLAGVLLRSSGALLIDGIGTWLAATIDECSGWSDPGQVAPRVEELLSAWRRTRAVVVAVSDEVGLSLVPPNAAGRIFTDLLGDLNRRLAAESERAALVVAGRVLELPG